MYKQSVDHVSITNSKREGKTCAWCFIQAALGTWLAKMKEGVRKENAIMAGMRHGHPKVDEEKLPFAGI